MSGTIDGDVKKLTKLIFGLMRGFKW
jgi:hypothetical protein